MAESQQSTEAPATTPPPEMSRETKPQTVELAASQNAADIVQECPVKPCDVSELALHVEGPPYKDADKDKVKEPAAYIFDLKTTDILREKEPKLLSPLDTAPDKVKKKFRDRMRKYDLVIEVISVPDGKKDYKKNQKNSARDPTKMSVKASFVGLQCVRKTHGALLFKRIDETLGIPPPENRVEVNKPLIETKDDEIMAHPMWFKDNGSDLPGPVGPLFGIIESIFRVAPEPVEYVIIAKSCGRRKKPQAPENKELQGLVRVFQKNNWAVKISIPAWNQKTKTISWSKARGGGGSSSTRSEVNTQQTRNLDGSHTNTGGESQRTDTRLNNGTLQRNDLLRNDSTGRQITGQATRQADGTMIRVSSTDAPGADGTVAASGYVQPPGHDGTPAERRSIHQRLVALGEPDPPEFEFTINHNEKSFTPTKLVEDIKALHKGILEAFQALRNLLHPKAVWGLAIGLDGSFFFGEITFAMEPDYVGEVVKDRYMAITPRKGIFGIDITVAQVELSAIIGGKIEVTGAHLELTGTLMLTVAAGFGVEATFDDFARATASVALVGSSKLTLEITAVASVAGWTIAKAQLTVSTGLVIQGKIEIDFTTEKYTVEVSIHSMAVELEGVAICKGIGRVDIKEPIFAPRELYSYKT